MSATRLSAELSVAEWVDATEAEGPGTRFALWLQGCPLRCPGCCNPEMLPFEGGRAMSAESLFERYREAIGRGVEGISFLGGEPFAQAGGAAQLAEAVRGAGGSVMVYSGFTLDEIRDRGPDAQRLLDATDLLVDGPYDRTQPESTRRWIGSRNQRLHFLTERYQRDDPCFTAPNTVEIRLRKGELTVNGWPALARALRKSTP